MSRPVKYWWWGGWWLISLVVIFAAGIYLGYLNRPPVTRLTELINTATPAAGTAAGVDFEPFWKTWEAIDQKFVDTTATSTASTTPATAPVTDQTKVWGAISGLVDSLGDPYSVFMPPTEKKSFEDEIRGNFGGVGMELGVKDRAIVVITTLPETPAKRAGIRSGDRLLAINDQTAASLSVSEAVNLIRGEVGTKVKLTMSRAGESKPLNFDLVRAVINVPTIETKSLPGQVFLIQLYNFGATSPDLFRQALRQFVASGDNKLILDLRGNPGGYLEAAVDMASWFLPAGQTVVTEEHGRGEPAVTYRSRGYDIFTDRLKMVILVDGGSASASEILAGALSEYGKGTLVGQKTFGKGSVQELIPVTADTSLKLTIAKWYTPKGVSISHNGLTPGVMVEVKDQAIDQAELGTVRDPFIAAALQQLTKNH